MVETMSFTSHDWEWFIKPISGDDCGMVYDCFNHIKLDDCFKSYT